MRTNNIHQLGAACLFVGFGASLSIADEISLKPSVRGTVKMVGVGGGGLRTVETGCRVGAVVVGTKTMFSKPHHTTYKTVLEFDLSQLPKGAKIDSASLQLTRVSVRPSSYILAWGFIGDGKVTQADWFGKALAGANSKLNEASSIPVTQFVQDLATTSKQYAGFLLSGEMFSPSEPVRFDSLSTETTSGPTLLIKYTIVK